MITSDAHNEASVFVDAHVHIHDAFRLGDFLDAAARNFSAQKDKSHGSSESQFVMCLTETQNANQFETLRSRTDALVDATNPRLDCWKVTSTEEPQSVRISHPQHGCIFVIAGRQIVTSERLEVLALGCNTRWDDGQRATDIIANLNRGDSVPVIPWGFGKWYGKRGETVMSLMRAHRSQVFFLGDNSGRPSILSQPPQFEVAGDMGIRILPGTDPLPFSREQSRAGLFGFTLPEPLDENKPWQSIRRQIINQNTEITPYGNLESAWRFARNQVAMQWTMHGPKIGRKT